MKQNRSSASWVVLSGLLVCVFWCAGCGSGAPPTGSVAGKVTYNGQPVGTGVVTFLNEAAGIGASSEIDLSGNYRIPMIRIGSYNVAIHRPPPLPEAIEQTASVEDAKLNIPEKYHAPQTSGLSVTVREGKNTNDFNL